MSHGIDATTLSDQDLLRELERLHATRHDTLRHGSREALAQHTTRMTALEQEYLRRRPDREIDPERTRDGARSRVGIASADA